MSNIDKEGIIIITISFAITVLIILCIRYFKCSNNNDFSTMSKDINQERMKLIT